MMKIINDEKILILPLNEMRNKTILLSNESSELLVQSLQSYFTNKKKNKCLICDDDNIPLKMDEINFIYISKDVSYLNNMDIKTKSIVSSEILRYIETNPRYFQSIDSLRNMISCIESDEGMFKLSKILSKGLDKNYFIKFNEFRSQSILEMFHICTDEISDSIKQLLILNIILFPLKDKPNIIYVDQDVDYNTFSWSKHLRQNDYLLIDNESLKETIDGYDLIKLACNSQLRILDETNKNIKVLSYMSHNLIKTNLSLQTEKNIMIFKDYDSNFESFLLKNAYYDVNLSL